MNDWTMRIDNRGDQIEPVKRLGALTDRPVGVGTIST